MTTPPYHCESWLWGAWQKCLSTDSKPDDVANSLAGLSVALTLATLALALLALGTAIGWFFWVRMTTKDAAKAEAEKAVPAEVRAYLDEKLPAMVNEIITPQIEGLMALARGAGQTPADQAKALDEESK